MSSKNEVHQTDEHLEQRWFLIELEEGIVALDEHKLDATRLKNFNVNLCQLSLDQNSELKPRFFTPRPNLPQPSDEVLNKACSVADPKQGLETPYSRSHAMHDDWNFYAFHQVRDDYDGPWRSKEPIDYTPYKSVYQFGAVWDGIPSSGALRMMDSAGKEFPHFKAVDFNHLEAENNTCFRGELLISLRMILGQLRKVCLVHHQIAPVLLMSLAGMHARLLECYYDEKSKPLMMRSSDLYELSNKTSISEAFMALTKYFLAIQ
ncbi:hypothetical protein ACN38_g3574 [Penicillium nordicum]|uniref:Uncharacterized protein n=1 Tax=Penicillium nordicum TaxID=229535 RepID=A0A0M9WHU9_9EURO|nr:hypothetical protein ACN38_g3574 [Penicillium nordicum]